MIAILETIIYFLSLIAKPEVFWNVLPLAIATILILLYYEIHKEESEDWETFLSNSLVLLFVAVSLFRYIYNLNSPSITNFIDYYDKSFAAVFLLLIGSLLTRFNFEHVLPEKLAKHLSSTLTINLIAFAVILFVFANLPANLTTILSLLIIIVVISLILNLLKIPLDALSKYVEKEKRKERITDAKEAKFEIDELEKQLSQRKKELKQVRLKKAEQEEREGIKLEKALKTGKRR